MTRFAAVGDVHGDCAAMVRALDALVAVHGPVDFILAVGDTEFNRTAEDSSGVYGPAHWRRVGDFPAIIDGSIRLPAPMYFIGGNHDPYPALDAHGPGVWATTPNGHAVTFMGRSGVAIIADLRVAFLSGIYSCKVSEAIGRPRVSKKDRTYWTRSEVEAIYEAAVDQVDILITHDWPSGLGTDRRGDSCGHPTNRALVDGLRPQLHVCGHMHHSVAGRIGETNVVALNHSGRPGTAAVFDVTAGVVSRLDAPVNAGHHGQP